MKTRVQKLTICNLRLISISISALCLHFTRFWYYFIPWRERSYYLSVMRKGCASGSHRPEMTSNLKLDIVLDHDKSTRKPRHPLRMTI